jgi:hypothetical protein
MRVDNESASSGIDKSQLLVSHGSLHAYATDGQIGQRRSEVTRGGEQTRFSFQFWMARMFDVQFVSLDKEMVELLLQGIGMHCSGKTTTTPHKMQAKLLVPVAADGSGCYSVELCQGTVRADFGIPQVCRKFRPR